jgi:cytochrome c553
VAPILKGQVPQYLEATMMAFKDADRSNDLFERMQSVSHKLTDDEIRALARYYGTEPLEE